MANKIHPASKRLGLRTSVLAVASCLAFSGLPLVANAAGLGKIVVFSALGQPLRAEIEVSATREELSDMKAQLASPDAFKQAGLDYATTLLSVRFSMDKRPNGQSVIKLTSDRPINDPFIDMLLELNWPTGRLVREYTFLLDPPEVTAKATAPVTPAVTNKPSVSSRTAVPIDDEVRSKAVAKIRTQESVQKSPDQKSQDRSVDVQVSREVKRGDTLRKIASETKPQGVSLEQMLVGLLRANQDAFDGGNMNRLKAGKILSVPDKVAVEAVSGEEARKIVIAQSSDWNAYRSRLAGVAAQSPMKDDGATSQKDAGKITAKVEDKATSQAESKDQVKVSRTETAGSKPGVASKRSEEDLVAKEKALKEANERAAALEKNVADLQKMVELKSQSLAELQKQASAKAESVEAKKLVEEPKPQPPVPVAPEVKSEAALPAPAVEKPVEIAAEKSAEPEIKQEPAPKAAEAPKPKPVAPPPLPEEPSIIEDLLDNPMALAGGGGILALIAAYFVARRRRAGKEEEPLELGSTLTPQSTSLSANSVFRSTGGQSVDTSSHTPVQTDFSQAGPGSIDTDEVDPVAEADVYMAYGRDAQAEEILQEARQKDPKRYAIHLKLLEIYAGRKDIKQFETLATDLYGETGGVGSEWEKAAAMGLKLDPGNPLFGSSASVSGVPDTDDTIIVPPSESMSSTVTLPGELSQLADVAVAPVVAEDGAPAEVASLTNLDFDLGLGDAEPSVDAINLEEVSEEANSMSEEPAALDFDLAGDAAEDSVTSLAEEVKSVALDFNLPDISKPSFLENSNKNDNSLDFDIGIASVPAELAVEPEAHNDENALTGATQDDGVEFDVSLTESTFLGRSASEPSSFDMSSIDLDLEEPELEIPVTATSPTPVGESSSASDLSFESVQIATEVNPNFVMEQAETIVSPQFAREPDQNLMPEQDFSIIQAETLINRPLDVELAEVSSVKDFSTEQAETLVNPQFGDEQDDAQEFDINVNEEVATKLDLAKAYEEMGDFEGARELLHEVIKEGDASQREKAQELIARIGG